jgi:hypothetical protein
MTDPSERSNGLSSGVTRLLFKSSNKLFFRTASGEQKFKERFGFGGDGPAAVKTCIGIK